MKEIDKLTAELELLGETSWEASDSTPLGIDFILNEESSTLDLLPNGSLYRTFKWGENDFPGNKDSNGNLGRNQKQARLLSDELKRILPERRANSGATIILTKTDYERTRAEGKIVSILKPIPPLTFNGYQQKTGAEKYSLVNEAAQSFTKMREEALKDGIPLIVVSGFRRSAKAKKNSDRTGNKYAVASYSSHMLGVAVDLDLSFGEHRLKVATRPFSTVIKMRQSPIHKWMFVNGKKFGWFPYTHEPWHWEYNPPGFAARFQAALNGGSDAKPASRVQNNLGGNESMLKNFLSTLGILPGLISGIVGEVFKAMASGTFDENKLADIIFYAKYQGAPKPLPQNDPRGKDWIKIRDVVRRLGSNVEDSTSVVKNAPPGFAVKKKKGKQLGLSRVSSVRLTDKLLELRGKGLISISDAMIDLFQRIANVEASGTIQAINTWDSAVVSSGFMQFTLQFGKLQDWIRRAPEAFRRYGIELGDQKYAWKSESGLNYQVGIKGASKGDLRWGLWAQRFYDSGLDDSIIAAEVVLAGEILRKHLERLKGWLKPEGYDLFNRFYQNSAYLRGMYHAAYNNLPEATRRAVQQAVEQAVRLEFKEVNKFITLFHEGLHNGYKALKDKEGPGRIITETKVGYIT